MRLIWYRKVPCMARGIPGSRSASSVSPPSTWRSATRSAPATGSSACPARRRGRRRPREKPNVGGFTTFKLDRIRALEPDLVLAFSDLQADISAELIRAGVTVFCTNQRSLDDDPRDHPHGGRRSWALEQAGARARPGHARRDPAGAGVLERLAGPAARLLRGVARPADRRDPLGVGDHRDRGRPRRLRRAPRQAVGARSAWSSPPRSSGAIPRSSSPRGAASRWTSRRSRGDPGWERISAVKTGQIHEIDGADILSPGPSVMDGAEAHSRDHSEGQATSVSLQPRSRSDRQVVKSDGYVEHRIQKAWRRRAVRRQN